MLGKLPSFHSTAVTLAEFEEGFAGRLWCVDNPADRVYTRADFRDGDALLFGSETKGLPPGVRAKYADRLLAMAGAPLATR